MFYFVLLSGLVLFIPLIKKETNNNDEKKAYCIFMFFITSFLIGFRTIYTAGVDTKLVYVPTFKYLCEVSLGTVFERYNDSVGFYFLSKCISYLTSNEHIYLLILAIVFVGSFCFFIYKNSSCAFLSFAIWIGLGYFSVGFQILKHAIALSVLLLSYKPLLERKLLHFVIIVILASLVHTSALIFLLAYPIFNMKEGLKQWLIIFAFLIIVSAFNRQVNDIINRILIFWGNSRYVEYVSRTKISLGLMGAIIQILLFSVEYYLIPSSVRQRKDVNGLFNMSMLSIVFLLLASVWGECFRIAMFFGIFNTILLPMCVDENCSIELRKKSLLKFGMASLFLLYFLVFGVSNAGLLDYNFFWE